MSAFDQAVQTVRFLSADAVERANSGHPGAPMGLAGIAVELFSHQLRYQPNDPTWANRDRFVLSGGHASALLYSVMHLAGYEVTLDDLKSFRQWGSKTAGHPEFGHIPGIETTTGPLGQGIGNAVGFALAGKMAAARLPADASLIDYRVYVLCGDGDMMEGVAMEAASLAGHLGLGNLVVIYDDNQITIDGSTSITFSEDVGARHEAMGWQVQRVDGHDPSAVRAAIEAAKAETARPSLIIARTHIAYGAPTKQDTSAAHGAPLGQAELDEAKRRAGWPVEMFHAPEAAYEPFRARVAAVQAEYQAWQQRVASLTGEARAAWDGLVGREVPADLYQRLLAVLPPKADATRSISATLQQEVAKLVPALVQGSADLAGSTKTTIKGSADVAPQAYAGRNLNYGIREHAMGSVMNGLTLSGFFIPVGSTFLIFSEYMRPTLRMAALMEQQAIYVFTHDSFFVGEDGPTHQPIEQIWALRLIPQLDVVRPADALECAAAWAHALSRTTAPTALLLTRQTLPVLKREDAFQPGDVLRGAYVLQECDGADLTFVASGSEVGLCVEAAALLAAKGKKARIVSAPCWDAFVRLPRDEQKRVLGSAPRVVVEAGVTAPWQGVAGDTGLLIGLDHFGSSAPAERLAVEFGFTAEQVAGRVLRELFAAS